MASASAAPGITIAVAFVASAGYAVMSDTPPSQFLVRKAAVGLIVAVVLGPGIADHVGGDDAGRWLSRLGGAIVAVAETGLFVVVPVTAVWQAAAARGWTVALPGRVVVGLVTVAAAVLGVGGRVDVRVLIVPAVLAAEFAATGSALVPRLGAALIEVAPPTLAAGREGRTDDRSTAQPTLAAR